MSVKQKEELFRTLLIADRKAANQLVDDWAKDNGYRKSVIELLEPALHQFGEIWAKKTDVSLAQGYIAGKIAEDIMQKAAQETQKSGSEDEAKTGIAVIGNIEDDYHALGRKLVGTSLRSAGWEVYDLGNDVLAKEFVDKAIEVEAKVVGASAMMYTNAKNMKKLRQEIDGRKLTGKIQLAVGGAIFLIRPELVKEVGGDGSANNAMIAVDLFQRLQKEAELYY